MLGGIRVLMPASRPAEFIADATIYPLPLAPRRVLGLMQLRGQPVTVLAAEGAAPSTIPVIRKDAVLVIGAGEDAPMAFPVTAPPRQLGRLTPWQGPLPGRPHAAFAAALGAPWVDQSEPAGPPWWDADFDHLFAALVDEDRHGQV